MTPSLDSTDSIMRRKKWSWAEKRHYSSRTFRHTLLLPLPAAADAEAAAPSSSIFSAIIQVKKKKKKNPVGTGMR